jgi:hypothetical protein
MSDQKLEMQVGNQTLVITPTGGVPIFSEPNGLAKTSADVLADIKKNGGTVTLKLSGDVNVSLK